MHGVTDAQRPDSEVRLHEQPGHVGRGVGEVLDVHVDPVVVPLEGSYLADPNMCVRRHAHVPRHDHARIANARRRPRAARRPAGDRSGAGRSRAGPCRAGTCRAGRAPTPGDSRARQRRRPGRSRRPTPSRPTGRAPRAGNTSQRTGRTKAPARIATAAPITTIATIVSPPAAAAHAPPIEISPQTRRTPMPRAARLATSPASPAGPSPETNHQTRTPAATRMATGMSEPREEESAPEKKGPGDAAGGRSRPPMTSQRLRPAGARPQRPGCPRRGSGAGRRGRRGGPRRPRRRARPRRSGR